jgi:hypothetical protein
MEYNALESFFSNQKRDGSPMERLLGNSERVSQFAQFYGKHAETIAVILAGKLNEYLSDPQDDKDTKQSMAFKSGLATLPLVLEACFMEIQKKKEESPGGQ